MHNTDNFTLETPSLPKGGGAVTGLKGNMAVAGPDGAAVFTLPLPVSAGRGYSPSLALSYHSRNGNGPFGVGWEVNLLAIRRRTKKGVPDYDAHDEFTGPDGEVLVPRLNDSGEAEVRRASALLAVDLGETFTVSVWRSRTEADFSRLEHWAPVNQDGQPFWVLYSPDGQLHLFGRNPQARISHPNNPAQTAVWLAESSVSATGEQIYWQHRAEDQKGCDETEIAAHPDTPAQRYPVAVWYGNRKAARALPALTAPPLAADWLFTLVFDYGERSTDPAPAPTWLTPGSGDWPCRQDCFSDYGYGFDLRTRRLCRQLLMYHAVTALAGTEKADDKPQLIARLRLNYNENAALTTLTSVQQLAYETGGAPVSLPPLTFDWQGFTPPGAGAADWQQRDDLVKMNLLQPYHLVDLNGEGIAGILYQDGGAWWYRAPVRQASDNSDAVTWEKATPLPSIPALRGSGILADLNGDGYMEWMVTTPGASGGYERTPEQEWRQFTPVSALPVEYTHPRALLADLTGNGLPDLALIGPKSVRFYAGVGDGWVKAQNALQAAGITLPVPGTDARILVAFSDMAGSGQQHLVEVRADGVRYWPNTGHGQFAQPVSMPGFSLPADTFHPNQLYLVDTDGSGTTDLIYAQGDRLAVYINQSGNRFAPPYYLNLPDGVRYNRTCSLQVADIQGLGTTSLILTVPHPQPQHWVCPLATRKPWLLSGANNNMGARHTLTYRSSAQFWLDEKAEAAAEGKSPPACYLPFALHLLCRTETTDEITGNRLSSTVRYRHGVWDGREREFRGFAFVETVDTDTLSAKGTAAELSLPAISRSWYATGLTSVDNALEQEYWTGDTAAWAHYIPRFTTGSGEEEQEYAFDDEAAFWLRRGMKGTLLRCELYGADGSEQADVPYTVTENRPQVRLAESRGAYPVILSSVAESRAYVYERVSSDPQCNQQVLLSSDEWGQPLKQVAISYPRRPQPAKNPWPDTLPETLFASAYDTQQQPLRLTLARSSWHTFADLTQGRWMSGLAGAIRSDVFTADAGSVPSKGLTLESLLGADSPVANDREAVCGGLQQIWYQGARDNPATTEPAFPPRRAFTESTVLDDATQAALPDTLTSAQLIEAGYTQAALLFARPGETEKKVWAARRGYVTYGAADHFFLPVSSRETLLTGEVTVTRDRYDCVITQAQDAAGLTVRAEYDWRFLMPVRIIDVNDNVQTLTVDALGRVTAARFWGTENGKATGYSDSAFTLPATADVALALTAPLPVAQCVVYVADSWQRTGMDRLPPHVVTLATDRYDADPQQQIRQQVTFSDGFGRVLQASVRQAAGAAWQRTEAGGLVSGADGAPAEAETPVRWAVTGRTEYDNKGQAIRIYQPYFLDSWRYVSDDSARQDLYADTHSYDPAGRVWQSETAKGGQRRTLFTPWFAVSEDENDTATQA
jgi:hypothetical protein